MITITRFGTKVKLNVEVASASYPGNSFNLYWDAGSEWAAGLLTDAMRAQLEGAVRSARMAAYADGYKDAKAKRAKNQWFSGRI